jgi:hypothetical protein
LSSTCEQFGKYRRPSSTARSHRIKMGEHQIRYIVSIMYFEHSHNTSVHVESVIASKLNFLEIAAEHVHYNGKG